MGNDDDEGNAYLDLVVVEGGMLNLMTMCQQGERVLTMGA